MRDYQSLIETKLTPQGVSGKDTIYACPNCEDLSTGHHLYVNYDKGYYNCFKCNSGGKRLEGLLKLLNLDIDYDYEKLYREQNKDLDSILDMKKKKVVKSEAVDYSTDLRVLTQYYNMHITHLSQTAYNYLINRGLTPYLIEKLRICEGVNRYGEVLSIGSQQLEGRDYSGRIMIPSLRKDGLISFYVGRDYTGNKKAKYLNPPKELVAGSEDIWNLDMVDSDSVIVCEGVMTAIAASPYKLNSVATYGKSIAYKSSTDSGINVTSQGDKLLAKKFKNYYIAYDADAHNEAIKSCKYLYDRGANVYLVLIDPDKYGAKADVADIGYEEFLNLLKNAIHYEGELSVFSEK